MDPGQPPGNIYCPQCGTECSVGDKFCRSCATALPTETPPVREEPTPPIAAKPGSTGRRRFAILGVLLVLAAGAVAFYVLSDSEPEKLTKGDETVLWQWCSQLVDRQSQEYREALDERLLAQGYTQEELPAARAGWPWPASAVVRCPLFISQIENSIQEAGWSKKCAITFQKKQLADEYVDPYLCE